METSVIGTKSVYPMLMTVLFYTTGFICTLRTAWLTIQMLVPAISRIVALYYPPSSAAGRVGSASGAGAGNAVGLLFKVVHTATGKDHLVPVPVSMYHASAAHRETLEIVGAPGKSLRQTLRVALLLSLVGAGSVAAYCYYFRCGPSAWTIARSISATWQRQRHGSPGTRAATDTNCGSSAPDDRCAKTKLNPAAPAFTPSPLSASSFSPFPTPSHPPSYRLDPAARTFAPRGCATPPSPTESAGPATPSPSRMPNAFALAAARVARAGIEMGKSDSGGSVRLPLEVGKMRVVRPEEVVVGERRAGEVFVFF